MAGCPLYTAGLNHSTFPSRSQALSPPRLQQHLAVESRRIKGRNCFTRTVVGSAHSHPRILKTNGRSRYGQSRSTLPAYDEDELGGADEDDDEDKDDWLSEDELEVEISDADRQRLKLKGSSSKEQGGRRRTGKGWDFQSYIHARDLDKRNGKPALVYGSHGPEKVTGCSTKGRFDHLLEEIDLDDRYFPLLDYLSTFGFKESHFIKMYEKHMPSLLINVESAAERLEYLLSVGVKRTDLGKIISRQPQILEYTVENNLKSHVSFLGGLGIPKSKIGQIITATPSLFSYSVENSLKPTIKYLQDEIGIQGSDIAKVVQLSPQILVQRIDVSWNARLKFLIKELDAPRQSIVKMVTKHPQILHYSIEDGLLPRINFLRSIGLQNSDVLKVSTSLTQVFSLSLEGNLKPKYMYLINELGNKAQSLTKYPMYLSLSLDQRIRPRHRFLVSMKKAPKGPFPLSSFVPTDECFCQRWAGTSVDEYLDFRQRLLLNDLAKKYKRR